MLHTAYQAVYIIICVIAGGAALTALAGVFTGNLGPFFAGILGMAPTILLLINLPNPFSPPMGPPCVTPGNIAFQPATATVSWCLSNSRPYAAEQSVQVLTKAPDTFSGLMWEENVSSGPTVYFGLQTGRPHGKGDSGDVVMLSVGGSLSFYSDSCHAWPKGATGFNCIVAYPFSTAHSYQLRMTETGEYLGVEVYMYWTMTVVDNSTHKSTKIADIALPVGYNADNVRDADIYLGKIAKNCSGVPRSKAKFGPPSGNTSVSGIDEHAYQFSGFQGSRCAQEGKQVRTGTVTDIELGIG